MQSVVDICNRALQKLGAARIQSLGDSSVNARACAIAYDPIRKALLRAHPWNFAIKRFQLAADAEAPLFAYSSAITLPTGWLKVLPPDPNENMNTRDWIIEGDQLLTNDTVPLNLRCVMDISDSTAFDPLFCEALASKLALELCESLTQSNTKKADMATDFKQTMAEARKANAIEKVPAEACDGTWITARI